MTVKTASIVISLLGLAVAPPATQAGSLSDALARHSERDVKLLRAQRDDVAARCTLGAVYARRNDLPRAALYLTACTDATLPEEVATAIARIARELKQKLRASDLSVLDVVTRPEAMTAEVDALPGETFTTPATLYLEPGRHTVRATKDGVTLTTTITTHKHTVSVIILGELPRKPVVPTDASVDFSQDNARESQESGPPPDVVHPNILPTKYQRGMSIVVADSSNPNAIEDPLAVRETMPVDRAYWLGVRVGGGMFDDGAAAARAGMSLAATARFTLAGNLFAAVRVDWSRRGGSAADTAIEVLGGNAGVGVTVLERRQLAVALIGQLRGDLRLTDTRRASEGMTTPVSRAGASVAAGIELALPRTPFTAGVRFEQGLTPLVADARDRAILVELGVDLR